MSNNDQEFKQDSMIENLNIEESDSESNGESLYNIEYFKMDK